MGITPTSTLPPLNGLQKHTLDRITHALHGLRNLYCPDTSPAPRLCVPKRPTSCMIHDDSVPDSGYASAEEDDDDIKDVPACEDPDSDVLRTDPFERAFVIKWLTGFIARSDAWISASTDEDDADQRVGAVDTASAILCAFSGGDDADGTLTRSFSFPTPTSRDVKVELNDAPLSGEDHTSVGLQSWASSVVLAKMMCADPAKFGLDRGGSRVLELGAGTGLLSIVVGKLVGQRDDGDNWSVVATDYHPEVLSNLSVNVDANFASVSVVDVEVLDWEHPVSLGTSFDVILAADVIYHPDHARWIRGCVERLLRRPMGSDRGGIFWLMIPVRVTGRHEGMYETVDKIFTRSGVVVLERVDVCREDEVGRVDESSYKLYKIGWI